MKRAARDAGVEIVVNARVDVFVTRKEPTDAVFEEGVARGLLYRSAGADCIYPIRLSDEHRIGEFVQRVRSPVNIMMTGRVPALDRLAALGVARVSFAGSLMRRAYAVMHDALGTLRAELDDLGSG